MKPKSQLIEKWLSQSIILLHAKTSVIPVFSIFCVPYAPSRKRIPNRHIIQGPSESNFDLAADLPLVLFL